MGSFCHRRRGENGRFPRFWAGNAVFRWVWLGLNGFVLVVGRFFEAERTRHKVPGFGWRAARDLGVGPQRQGRCSVVKERVLYSPPELHKSVTRNCNARLARDFFIKFPREA